ncbi:MAG TPA: type II secretion system F family protein [Methanocorpusculum sp.]|nr:type II secretion system F family protein [Methanocorpusculum sp.]
MAEYIPPLSELVSWLYVMHTADASMYKAVSSYAASGSGFYAEELKRTVLLVEKTGCDPYFAIEQTAEKTRNKEFGIFLSEYAAVVKTSGSPVSYLHSRLESLRVDEKAAEEKRAASLSVFAEVFIAVFVAGILFAVIVFLVLGIMNNASPFPLAAIVYGVLPLGTICFMLVLDIMYPAPPRRKVETPSVQHIITPADKTEKQILRHFKSYEKRKGFREFLQGPKEALIHRPSLIFIVSIPAGIAVSGVLLLSRFIPTEIVVSIGLILIFTPYALFSLQSRRRTRDAEKKLPSVYRLLSSASERGVTISKGLSKAASNIGGILGKELSATVRDIRFSGSVYDCLGRLRNRLQVPSADKSTLLIQEASKHTADMSLPFRLCADEAAACAERKAQRTSSMQLYVMIMYISYGVFIFTQILLTSIFMDAFALSGNSVNISIFSRILADAVLIHGVCCGLAAGKLSGSGISGGILHACILLSIGAAASAVMSII